MSLKQIKASAGSGKTYAITRQFVNLLETGASADSSFRRILASTFTNAATLELRDGIINYLKKIALGREPDCSLQPDAAEKHLEAIFRDLDALNIRTIDSLIHQIVRTSALDLDLSPDFETSFNLKDIFEPILESVYEDAKTNEHERVILSGLWQSLLTYKDSKGFFAHSKLMKELEKTLESALLDKFSNLANAEEIKKTASLFQQKVEDAVDSLLAALADAKLSLTPSKRKKIESSSLNQNYSTTYDDPIEKLLPNKEIPAATAKAWTEWQKAVKDRNAFFAEKNRILNYLNFIYFSFFLIDRFQTNLKEDNIAPSVIFPLYASRILNSQDGVSNALCRLGSRLSHFLVDEFQDTSREQWSALNLLAEEALANGGSLICVGDVKQSIYGWRNGDPTLFDEVFHASSLLDIEPEPDFITLEKNWRSAPNIIGHNNNLFLQLQNPEIVREIIKSVFPKAMTPSSQMLAEGADKIIEAYADVFQKLPDNASKGFPPRTFDGYVSVAKLDAVKSDGINEESLQKLVSLLQEIGLRRPWSDVMILVRNNDQAAMTAEALLQHNIPVITENSLLLKEHPLISQIVSFLSFLENPENNIAFFAMITGNVFLESARCDNLDRHHLLDWLFEPDAAETEKPLPLYKRFQNDFPDEWRQIIEPFFNQADLMTPYDLLMEWNSFMEIEKRYGQQTTFLRRFMELVFVAEKNDQGSLTDFLESWNDPDQAEKAPMPEAMNAVRVMTIHKAKGLQAPVAIVPWTNFEIKPSARLFAQEKFGVRFPNSYASHFAGDHYCQDLLKQLMEGINLFYVALTRPQEELYIFHALPSNKSRKYFSVIFEKMLTALNLPAPYELGQRPVPPPASVEFNEGKTKNISSEKEFAAPDQKGKKRRPMEWLPRLKIFRNPIARKTISASERGSLFHLCLERLDLEQEPEDAAMRALSLAIKNSGLRIFSTDEVYAEMREALVWLASIPQLKKWLQTGQKEQSMINSSGTLLRADLIVPGHGKFLVIDYKTGEPGEDDIRQLRDYLKCLAETGIPLNNLQGLLIYADKKFFRSVDLDSLSEPYADFSLLPS